jgi:hypothetical protein
MRRSVRVSAFDTQQLAIWAISVETVGSELPLTLSMKRRSRKREVESDASRVPGKKGGGGLKMKPSI